MQKQVQIFLDPTDEIALTHSLREAIPSIRFIDGTRWPTPTPPSRPSIGECSDRRVFAWDPIACPALPALERPDGSWDGPAVGPVAELTRSITGDGVLRSGRLAISYSGDNPAIKRFLEAVWRVVQQFTAPALESLDGRPAPEYRIGPSALRVASEPGASRLRDRSVEKYFRPRSRR